MQNFKFDEAPGTDLSPLKNSLCLDCWETMVRNFGTHDISHYWEEPSESMFANSSAVDPKNCDHCRLMREATRAFWDAQPSHGSDIRSEGDEQCVDGYTIIRATVVDSEETQPEALCLEVSAPSGVALPWPGYKQATAIAGHANSVECFEKINAWVEECSANHPACVPISREGPKSLIDTGPLCEDAFVRLVDWPGSDSESVKYCALSYSWGTDQQWHFTTTRETEKLRRQHIPMEQLPPTLQDAVTITRGVGCRYLWELVQVDAICIIQRDQSDWESESPRMSAIYGNAFLVLAATEATSPGDDIFAARPPVAQFDFHSGEISYPVSVRQRDDHSAWRQRYRVVSSQTVPRLPVLRSRAWAFQERILASRIVHFTATELVWECNTHCRCECSELEGKAPQNKFGAGQSLKSFFARELAGHGAWETVVEHYSVRQLTVATDLLPALSGLARRLASPELGTYLAGVWSSQLPDALLWYTFGDERSGAYRAPSWSWAARKGEVRIHGDMGFHYGNMCAEVVAAECHPAGDNPYGAVTDGYIVLRGEFKPFNGPQNQGDCKTWALRVRESQAILLEKSQRVEGAWEMVGNSDYKEGIFNGGGISTVKIV
ncbi:Uu.00g109210.m01.CDS01 [Anthostomella pinea]|uniref:Uu.00g109210.m01.CDS01 n=1 Tax=Anthostomella pinea TaxID=933095 RepID=A0AAI8VEL8_9PEZI|nr:Uu.00g109210.m01.CDS01 [Anthostomella pinea]